ncbi:MAG TPA: AbrB/MazE/SpoVT family DNA-binding domain-containing protein [Chloroflexia bacterium]
MVANKTKIVRIGNSQGVRIPRNLLEQAGFISDEGGAAFGQEVELEVGQEGILIRHAHHARAGWAEQLQQMAKRGDDALLDPAPHSSSWDEHEWVW